MWWPAILGRLGGKRPGGGHRHVAPRPSLTPGPDRRTVRRRGPAGAAGVPAKVPVGVAFAKRSGMVRDGTADEFEALAGRLAVFRFEPA